MKSAGSLLKPVRRSASVLTASSVLLAGAFGSVHAAPFTLGVGGGVDAGHGDCAAGFECDRSSTHLKLSAGYRIDDAWELQLAYFGAGRFKGGDVTPLGTAFGGTFNVSGVSLTGGYRHVIASQWSLTGRAGLAGTRTRFDYVEPSYGSASQSNVHPLLGLNLSYALTPQWRVGLDYDVTRFKVYQSRGTLQMFGLAVQYAF